jgi:GWxTD domain-containing protein
MKKLLLSIITILVLISSHAYTQRNFSKGKLVQKTNGFYIESIVQPFSKDSVDATFLFRIDNSRLRFSQELLDNSGKEMLVAHPNVEIEIKDSEGIIRKRIPWNKTLSFPLESDKTESSTLGYASARLKKDSYEAKFTLRDKTTFIKKKKLNIDAKVNENIVSSIPIFAQQFENTPNTYSPIVSSGNIPFESKNVKAFFYAKNMEGWKFTLNSIEEKDFQNMWAKKIALEGEVESLSYPPQLILSKHKGSETIHSLESKEREYKIYQIQIPVQSIRPQKYELKCFLPGSDTITYEYDVIWENKPKSLYEIEYSCEIMYYLLDDEAYNKMESGDEEEQAAKLIAYWEAHDSSPKTPYIESMTTYFERADYAKKTYSTVRHKDGARTPRGQICMLYGIPDTIEDTIIDKQVLEIWNYEESGRKFTFEVPSPGEYKLIKIEE